MWILIVSIDIGNILVFILDFDKKLSEFVKLKLKNTA